MTSFLRSNSRSASLRRRWAIPACECLETRALLTGNLTANLGGSTLKITGDGGNHEIRIVGTAEGELTLSGVNNTSINDVNNASENFSNVKNISIDFGGGHCTVAFITTDIAGTLTVKAEGGNDKILFGEGNGGENSFGKFISQLGSGNNEVSVDDDVLSIPGTVKITNGNGNNTVDLDPDVSLQLGKTTIIGGSGSDFIDLGDVNVLTKSIKAKLGDGDNDFFLDGNFTTDGKITVTGGNGPDNFEPGDGGGNNFTVTKTIKLNLGDGTNFVEFQTVNSTLHGSLKQTGGSGTDTFDIDSTHMTFNGAVSIQTGGGNDVLLITNADFNAAVTLDTGDGADSVQIENNDNDSISTQFAAPAKINLGNDNDELKLGLDANDFITTLASFSANGGSGTNTLFNSPSNVFDSPPTLTGF